MVIKPVFGKMRRFGAFKVLKAMAFNFLYRKKYCIKKFYISNLGLYSLIGRRKSVPQYDYPNCSKIFQYEVYGLARKIIERDGVKSVLDMGCGCGSKLSELIYPVCSDITGIDIENSINRCRQAYSFGQWLVDDIENPRVDLKKDFGLIMSVDVIEHLTDPDKLLAYIKRHANENTTVIISTPERDLVNGRDEVGPPVNHLHVREWNREEFRRYISSSGFEVLEHFLTEDERGSGKNTCQVILCKVSAKAR